MTVLHNYKLVLLDIEGTITSLSFVKDKLFGYVRQNLRRHLNENYEQEAVQTDLKDLFEEALLLDNETIPQADKKEEVVRKAEEIVLRWMDVDQKCSSLKQLQGHMFEEAFHSGAVVTEFLPDVLPSIRRLKPLNIKVSIYSSGSVFAQKLLFAHTPEGDLTDLVSAFYDTSTGAKVEAESYRKICEMESLRPEEVLFLTDLVQEAAAARRAGCGVGVMLREGNARVDPAELEAFQSFVSMEELFL